MERTIPERLRPMIELLPGSRNKEPIEAADNMIYSHTFKMPPHRAVKYEKGIVWNEGTSRSFQRLLHGHTFLGCLTEAYRQTDNPIYVEKSMEIIKDWIKKHPFGESQHLMAYHDETTALRLLYWIRFYLFTYQELLEEDIGYLEDTMRKTARLLSKDDFHSAGTNHGMFQDIALLAYAVSFLDTQSECRNWIPLAIRRLTRYFESIFTAEGVHKEHSPSYHYEVAMNLKKLAAWLMELDPPSGKAFQSIYEKSEKYGTAILLPDGSMPPIGDTEPKKIKGSIYEDVYESPKYRYAVTAGLEGEMPSETDMVFPESGYAVFRDDWSKKEKGTYVLFSAAYHTSYHKHSDDLGIYLYSGGEILTEAGPNGYNYKDEYTQYAYSSTAHNTVMVDGQGLPRVDGKHSRVYMDSFHIGTEASEATGVNGRFDGVRHERNVLYKKQEGCILIRDRMVSEEQHQYKLLWHLAPDLKVYAHDRIIECFRENKKVAEIEFTCDASFTTRTVKGKELPEIQGWMFPEMEAKRKATVIEVEISGDSRECLTEVRLTSFRINRSKEPLLREESHFKSTRDLNYSFVPATDDALRDHLVVVFSAINNPYRFTYNYMKTLDGIGANKLFILDDFGSQGAYYIGKNKDFSIETSVAALIHYIMAKYGILHKNVIMAGSSKGGYAALYFGIKYSAGTVIAGGPQSRLGTYLVKESKQTGIAEYMAGGSGNPELLFLNDLLETVLEQPSDVSPAIHLYVGTKDDHFRNHVLPLYEVLKNKGFQAVLKVEEEINHDDLKVYFPFYFKKTISRILQVPFEEKMPPIIQSVVLHNEGNDLTVTCAAKGDGLEYAYYVYRDDDPAEKFFYRDSPEFHYEAKESGSYMIRVHVKNTDGQQISRSSNHVKIERVGAEDQAIPSET